MPAQAKTYKEFAPIGIGQADYIDDYADLTYPLEGYRQKWTAPELRSVQDYVGPWYSSINQYLRKTEQFFGNELADIKFRVKAIDAALKKTIVKENTILFRGANLPELTQLFDKGENLAGSVWLEDAYMSTSLNKNVAVAFSQEQSIFATNAPSPVIFRIKAEKGTKGAYVSHVNREFHRATPNYHNDESEILLKRSTPLYITGAKKVDIGGTEFLELEVEIWSKKQAKAKKARTLSVRALKGAT